MKCVLRRAIQEVTLLTGRWYTDSGSEWVAMLSHSLSETSLIECASPLNWKSQLKQTSSRFLFIWVWERMDTAILVNRRVKGKKIPKNEGESLIFYQLQQAPAFSLRPLLLSSISGVSNYAWAQASSSQDWGYHHHATAKICWLSVTSHRAYWCNFFLRYKIVLWHDGEWADCCSVYTSEIGLSRLFTANWLMVIVIRRSYSVFAQWNRKHEQLELSSAPSGHQVSRWWHLWHNDGDNAHQLWCSPPLAGAHGKCHQDRCGEGRKKKTRWKAAVCMRKTSRSN